MARIVCTGQVRIGAVLQTIPQYVLDLLPSYKGTKRSNTMRNVAKAFKYDCENNKHGLHKCSEYTQEEINNWLCVRPWIDRKTRKFNKFDADIKSVFQNPCTTSFMPPAPMTVSISNVLALCCPKDRPILEQLESRDAAIQKHEAESACKAGEIEKLKTQQNRSINCRRRDREKLKGAEKDLNREKSRNQVLQNRLVTFTKK